MTPVLTTAAIYVGGFVFFFCVGTLIRWITPEDEPDYRRGARLQLASFIWPIMLLYLGWVYGGVYGGRAIGKTFRIALQRDPKDS